VNGVLFLRQRRSAQRRYKTKKEGGKLDEGLNAALHKTSPRQGERPWPRRERRWLWPVALARGPLGLGRCGRQEEGRK
jgi:hypothetical protein